MNPIEMSRLNDYIYHTYQVLSGRSNWYITACLRMGDLIFEIY